MVRVSTFFPANEKSFVSFVPTGNCHAFGSDASMLVPGGSEMVRCFSAPSVQSGY